MPRHCSAGGCKSRDNRETRNAGITFHKLPKGATRRSLWITNSHRAASWDPQTDFVYFCSKHFTPESFELTGCSGIRRLKEDAFPTEFESSSATTRKSLETPQKQDNIPVRRNPCSAACENTGEENDKCQMSEFSSSQKIVAAAEKTGENIPEPSHQTSQVEQLSQQLQQDSHPHSSSRYMRRLPPPPGFYLPKEHSYAQLCPLLWRRRYDQAIDCLEKALRQLHAARRRENRLRSTVLRLRDKRLRHTLLVSQDGSKNKGRWTSGWENRQNKGVGGYLAFQLDSETDAKSEDAGLCGDQMEVGSNFLTESKSCSERDKEYCFYCGRGQLEGVSEVACRFSVTGKEVQATMNRASPKIPESVENRTCGFAENGKPKQIVRLERPPGKSVETYDSNIRIPQVLTFQHVVPAGLPLSDTHDNLQFLGSQQELPLSDMCEGQIENVVQEHQLDLQQQELLWVQNSAEGQIILVPFPAEDNLQSLLKMEGVSEEAQSILVSELNLKRELQHMMENQEVTRGGRAETAFDDEHGDQQTVVNNTSVEMREDVREKLKEHLEGFHLQLSTEFSVF